MDKRELEMSYAAAMQSVCASMASAGMMGAVFISDPTEAAKSFGDSMRWQMAGTLASLGKPELVTQFLEETKCPTP